MINLLAVSTDFWTGVVFTIIAFMILIFVILLIISFTKPFKRAQELYEEDIKKQKTGNNIEQEQGRN